MFRRLLVFSFAAFVIGLVGCDKGPVSTNTDQPVRGAAPVESKNKKSAMVEAAFEDPPRK
jgi:hypothetical protein